MTDPLARIEAMIETLGSREARFWTPLDTSQEQASNAEAPENCGFGQFGQFGNPTGDTIGDDLVQKHENASDSDAGTSQVPRASSLIQRTVQSVQSVQKHQKRQPHQSLAFGQSVGLGVQNRRSGVQGPASERLKRLHPSLVSAPDGTSTGWIAGVALLRDAPAPRGYPQHAWQQLILDSERFLERWGAQAASLGWRDWELFGCHRVAPWGRIQGMGLVLLLRGRELAALTKSEAAIRTTSGARQTYHRKPRDPLDPRQRCLVWEL